MNTQPQNLIVPALLFVLAMSASSNSQALSVSFSKLFDIVIPP